ncbi:hypothetical protein [Priestia aryabhattai]|uniref:hypothetical protein n=1 Tax=Priestia aryabhattai TaxID=412384 RepID=UPI0030D293BD
MEDTLVEVYRKRLFKVPYKEVIVGYLEGTNYFDLSDFIISVLRVRVVVVGEAIDFFFINAEKRACSIRFKLFFYGEFTLF